MATHPFALTLLRWFSQNRRELPWRGIRDPYLIWLSEVILQQTRIQQGLDYWLRFTKRWPTVELLAAATEDEVLREWQGLGYYSRARNLHKAARQVVAMGHFPDTFQQIRLLKGVGDYTAAAIASIAYGQPKAVVDGNVYRVLSRYFAIHTPINTTAAKREFNDLAQQLLPADRAADFNQAMMDFGAMQCVPRSPQCHLCPLSDGCAALSQQLVEKLPVKQPKAKVRQRKMTYVYLRCCGFTALRRRGAGDIWQGLWEPWLIEGYQADIPAWAAVELPGVDYRLVLLGQGVRHVLTHRAITADFYLLETPARPALSDDYVWVSETTLDHYAVPRLVELLFEAVARARI